MEHKGQKYNFVNEKIVNGVTHTIYRCDTNPKKTIIVSNYKVKKVKKIKEITKLREEWKKLHA